MRFRFCLSLGLLMLGVAAAPLAAATPHLVKDIDPVPHSESSFPNNFVNVLPGFSFFNANDGETGDELWRTDGTAGGTFRLTDACPGICGSRPAFVGRSDRLYLFQATGASGQELWSTDGSPGGTFFLTRVQFAGSGTWVAGQRLLYFVADDGIHGAELWRTDGTPAGTFLVTDLRPGLASSDLAELIDLNGKLYFRADDGRGPGLWTSDGTPQGTRLVKNLSPSSNIPDPLPFSVVLGRTLYFTAPTPKHGTQLWRSDGTAKGTSSFTSFKPQPDSSPFSEFAALGNRLFFVAETKGPGRQLWVTDGTAKGTRTLTNFPPRSVGFLTISTVFGNRLVFAGDDGPHGFELWTTDGTPRGTSLLKDLCPGPCSGATGEAIQAGSLLYLAGRDGVHGQELWVSNGTAAGTRLIADLCAGSCDSAPSGIRPAGGQVYFVATDGTNGRQVWRSDSTAQGTFPLTTDFSPLAFATTIEGFVQGSTLIFTTSDDESGRELWRSDGSPQGTGLLADLNPSDAGGSDPAGLMPLGDKLYFLARSSGETGLWTSDGTGAGTVQLPPLPENHGLSSQLAGVSGTIFFIVALRDEPGASLWRTVVNGNLRLTPPALNVQAQMKAMGNLVFFEATDDDHGEELWVTDGSVTHLVADIEPGLVGSHPRDFTPAEGRLYFTVMDFDGNRRQLWRSDGTEAGTALVQEAVSNPTFMTVHGGRLWFFAQDEEGESHLWSTDGTSAGTRIEPLLPGPGSVTGGPMFWDGNRVFFSGAATGLESGLYVWDGTPGSLHHLGDLWITEEFFNPVPGVVSNGVLYFSGHDFENNLWVSDGTEAGTRKVLDASGNPVPEPHYFQTFAGGVYFTNQDSLFRTDGTAAGTQSLAMLFAPGESGFHELVAAGPRLFFRKWERTTGTELWALEAN